MPTPHDAAHPLRDAVSSLCAVAPWVSFAVDPTARPGDGAILASELLGSANALDHWHSQIHAARVSRFGRSVPSRVAAGDLIQQASDIAAWLGAALFHHAQLVPLASLTSTIVTLDDEGQWTSIVVTDPRFACLASDSRAAHSDALGCADEDALVRILWDTAIAAGSLFVESWTPPQRMGPRLRWGAISDALDSAPWAISEGGDEAAGVDTAERVMEGAPRPLIAGTRIYRDRDRQGRPFYTRDRHACCFEYLLPDTPACFSCPRTTHEERRRRAGEWPDDGPPD